MSKYYKAEDMDNAIREAHAEAESNEIGGAMFHLHCVVSDLPTIDIVYCKDCRWSEPNREGDYDCKCHIPIFRVPADGWCYLGERTEE